MSFTSRPFYSCRVRAIILDSGSGSVSEGRFESLKASVLEGRNVPTGRVM